MTSFLQTDRLDDVLDSIWGSGTPVTWYIALFTTLPDEDGNGGVEASWPAYARVASTNDATNWPAASGGVKNNAATLDFGIADAGPSSILGAGFYDDPTSVLPANFWACIDVTGAPVIIANGAAVAFGAGDLDLGGCTLTP